MSESPERKVLKNMLKKLKAKTINSEADLLKSFTDLYEQVSKTWETLAKIRQQKIPSQDARALEIIGLEMRGLDSFIGMLASCSKRTIDDFKMYIESLEQYSTELDKTLNDIFEQAEKMAEEQRKKQEELEKKKPKYTV